jgi:3-hydroxybutyryl-CoA dehydratase
MNDHAFENLSVDQHAEHEYVITGEVYEHFLAAFGDVSPLHMDDAFARELGFSGKVMHGSILNGFISHFVGVLLPGRRAILHSVAVEYRAPSFLGDRILIQAKVTQRVESLRLIMLGLTLTNVTRRELAARAKVQVGFTS